MPKLSPHSPCNSPASCGQNCMSTEGTAAGIFAQLCEVKAIQPLPICSAYPSYSRRWMSVPIRNSSWAPGYPALVLELFMPASVQESEGWCPHHHPLQCSVYMVHLCPVQRRTWSVVVLNILIPANLRLLYFPDQKTLPTTPNLRQEQGCRFRKLATAGVRGCRAVQSKGGRSGVPAVAYYSAGEKGMGGAGTLGEESLWCPYVPPPRDWCVPY